MSQKLYLKLLPEYADIFSRLSNDDLAILFRYVMQYLVNQDVAPIENPLLDMAFAAIKVNIRPVDGRSLTSSENGRLGGRPSKKKPKSDLGFQSDGNENQKDSPNNILFIKEELINKGNIKSDNISSNEDNYLPVVNNINLPKKDDRNINISAIQKGGSSELGAKKKTSKESLQIDWDALLRFFNQSMANKAINPIQRITENRKHAIMARAREFGKESIMTAIEKAAASDFLNGRHEGKAWKADFDWIFRPTKFPKIIEGNYDNNIIAYERQSDNSQRQRIESYARTVQELYGKAEANPYTLANRVRIDESIQRLSTDGDNSEF